MSRILVDLADPQVEALNALAERERRPRAAVIRDAIDDYLARCAAADGADVFGLWRKKPVDGLAYQQASRAEW